MPPRKRRRAPTNAVEAANRKSDEEFIRDHLQPSPGWTSWTHPTTGEAYTLALKSAPALSHGEMQACFDLVERTSGADYRASAGGWRPAHKMREMRSPELRYILVKAGGESNSSSSSSSSSNSDETKSVRGFASLMPTFEEGEAVVYCYEIHLMEELRRTGMGRRLMDYLVKVAESIPVVQKVMLTCFVANGAARGFYERLGFERDAMSPVERKLRSGTVFVPDYAIMSRRIRGGNGGEDVD